MRRFSALASVVVLALAGLVAAGGPRLGGAAQDATPSAGPPAPLTVQHVSLAQAQAAVDAVIADAEARGLRMVVAVVDPGANLVAFARMDGALLGSVDVAIKKARTSVLVQGPSGALGPLAQPGQPLYGVEVTNEGLVTFPGGLPLIGADGAVVGAIGVSGSSVEDDLAVAEAGVAALAGPGAATPAP